MIQENNQIMVNIVNNFFHNGNFSEKFLVSGKNLPNLNPTYMSNMKGRQQKRIRQESALKRTGAQLSTKLGLLTSRMRSKEPRKRKTSQIFLLLKRGQNSHKED